MKYELHYSHQALKDIKKLSASLKYRIEKALVILSKDPYAGKPLLKHRLMDISVIIGRTAAYIITILAFGMVYLFFAIAYKNFISANVDSGFLGMTIVYGILVGEFFQRVRFFIQTSAEKAFLKGKYDYRKILSRMSEKLTGCKTMGDINAVLEGDFKEEVEIINIKLYLT